MWTTYGSFLALRDDTLVEHAMEVRRKAEPSGRDEMLAVPCARALSPVDVQCLLVFQLLATGRQIALRLLMRNVLIGSFEEAINNALFNQLVLLAISKPPGVGPDGAPLPLERDVAYNGERTEAAQICTHTMHLSPLHPCG